MANLEQMGKEFEPAVVAFTRVLGVLGVGSIFMGAYRSANIAQERGSGGRIRFLMTAISPSGWVGRVGRLAVQLIPEWAKGSRRRRDRQTGLCELAIRGENAPWPTDSVRCGSIA